MLKSIRQPSKKSIHIDGGGAGYYNYTAIKSSVYPQVGYNDPGMWWTDMIRAWHNGQTNCVFLDNHAAPVVMEPNNDFAKAIAKLPY
ncbi:MAG: hypothetical protein JXR97_08220 [Planctomycetes bacterium]|nr:hypothetical protein [Planctomycetota bacterium]